MIEAPRTSISRLAGFACKHALDRSRYGNCRAAIVSTGPLAKMNIPHSEIANNLPKALQPFDIVSVDDILNKRIPGVLKGGMVVTGYSDKFLREDIDIRNIPHNNLRYDDRNVENTIQSDIRAISIKQGEDFRAGRLWFLILSETLPHGSVFNAHCWWGNGPFETTSAVSEMRISEKSPREIDLVSFRPNLFDEWVETGISSVSTNMLD
jgi:hypothetical protein